MDAERARSALYPHAMRLMAVGAVLALCAAAWAVALVRPDPPEPRAETQVEWRDVARLHHEAEIVVDSPAWANGTRLRDEPGGYFLRLAPRADLQFLWALEHPAAAEGNVTVRAWARVADVGREGQTYWSLDRPLLESTVRVESDAPAMFHIPLDVEALADEVRRMDEAAGGHLGSIHFGVHVQLSYLADSEFAVPREREALYSFPLEMRHPVYVLPTGDEAMKAQTHTTRQWLPPEPATLQWGALLTYWRVSAGLVLGLAALAIGAWARAGGAPASDPFQVHQRLYADWILETRDVPAEVTGGSSIEVASLEALAHLAAERRTRILHAPSSGRYHVVHEGVLYTFCAPGARREAAPAAAATPAPADAPAVEPSAPPAAASIPAPPPPAPAAAAPPSTPTTPRPAAAPRSDLDDRLDRLLEAWSRRAPPPARKRQPDGRNPAPAGREAGT